MDTHSHPRLPAPGARPSSVPVDPTPPGTARDWIRTVSDFCVRPVSQSTVSSSSVRVGEVAGYPSSLRLGNSDSTVCCNRVLHQKGSNYTYIFLLCGICSRDDGGHDVPWSAAGELETWEGVCCHSTPLRSLRTRCPRAGRVAVPAQAEGKLSLPLPSCSVQALDDNCL